MVDRTTHGVPEPTRTWWVLSLRAAGAEGDRKSQPHNVSSDSDPVGAVLGKNCKVTENVDDNHE